jgi:hypothetical protein
MHLLKDILLTTSCEHAQVYRVIIFATVAGTLAVNLKLATETIPRNNIVHVKEQTTYAINLQCRRMKTISFVLVLIYYRVILHSLENKQK